MMMRREICLIAIILSLIELVELVSSRSKSEDNGDKDNYNGSNTLINRLVKTVRDQSNRRRSADILLMTNDLVQSDEARQFCGETLYYVVEYYCVFVKGTSVYVPNENDDNVQFDDDNSSVGEKKNNELKSKRKRQTLNDTTVLLNVPNLIGFVRLFMIAIMIFQIRKRPIAVFGLCLGSGLLDMIDGRLARYFQVVSKFGALVDLFVDRLTTQAQFFALASFFPAYSMLFMLVSTFEMIADLARTRRSLFLAELNLKPHYIPLEEMDPMWRFYLVHIEPFTWYLSDFFYWLLYFSAFVMKISKPLPTTSCNLNSPTKSHLNISSGSSRCSTIRKFINDFNLTINSLYIFISEFIRIRLGLKIIDFSPLFRLLMYFSLLGAFIKAWNNFYIIMGVSSDMLSILLK